MGMQEVGSALGVAQHPDEKENADGRLAGSLADIVGLLFTVLV